MTKPADPETLRSGRLASPEANSLRTVPFPKVSKVSTTGDRTYTGRVARGWAVTGQRLGTDYGMSIDQIRSMFGSCSAGSKCGRSMLGWIFAAVKQPGACQNTRSTNGPRRATSLVTGAHECRNKN